jgi:U3 small nucleolar RNA-associated protein 3
MQEADFAFDESEWLAPKEQAGQDEEVVTEVLKEVEVTEDMGPEERYKLLQARYPEFDYLVDEFRELQSLLPALQKEAEGKPAKSLEVVKSWLLGCYVAALASYFAILTSPSRDGDGSAATLIPSELRDHEVMETLVQCREAWLKAKALRPTKPVASSTGMLSPPEEEDLEMLDAVSMPKRRTDKLSKAEIKANKKKAAEAARKAQAVEQSLADLSTLLKSTKKAGKAVAASAVSADAGNDDNRSDFGDEEALDARAAADKARRKKSLKFYTSQIVQKASKRAGAGRDAGGDMDIPYRERLVSRP